MWWPWKFILAPVLVLQCSPLCLCAVAQMLLPTLTTGDSGKSVVLATGPLRPPGCPVAQDKSRDCPYFCANTSKISIPQSVARTTFDQIVAKPAFTVTLTSNRNGAVSAREYSEPPDVPSWQTLPLLN